MSTSTTTPGRTYMAEVAPDIAGMYDGHVPDENTEIETCTVSELIAATIEETSALLAGGSVTRPGRAEEYEVARKLLHTAYRVVTGTLP
jgi:hypothetical protein